MKKLLFGFLILSLLLASCKDNADDAENEVTTDLSNETTVATTVLPSEATVVTTKQDNGRLSYGPVIELSGDAYYSTIYSFSEGLAAFSVNHPTTEGQNVGYINKKGEIIIPAEHFYIYYYFQYPPREPSRFSEGIVSAPKNDKNGLYNTEYKNKYGFYNIKGEIAIPFKSGFCLSNFVGGIAAAYDEKSEKYGYINKTGKTVIPFEYDYYADFSENLASVGKKIKQYDGQETEKFGFIESKGKTVIPFIYDNAQSFSQGMAAVSVRSDEQGNSKWGYIDKTGKTVVPFIYDEAGEFSDGVACVVKGDKFGFINKKGEVVIDFIYDKALFFDEHGGFFEAPKFNNGLFAICTDSDYENRKWGFINTKGKTVIPFEYDGAGDFSNGLAVVSIRVDGQDNRKCGYIDANNKILGTLDNSGMLSKIEAEKNIILDNIAETNRKIEASTVKASSAGQLKNPARRGQTVSPGAMLATIITQESLELECFVRLADIGSLTVGGKAEATLKQNNGDKVSEAVITKILNVAEEVPGLSTKRVRVVLEISRSDFEQFGQGYELNIRFVTSYMENCVIIPKTAVFRDNDSPAVWVIVKGAAAKRLIEIGEENSGSVLINSGVLPGDLLVINAENITKEGQKLKAK